MTPEDFVARLRRIATENGVPFARLHDLEEAESNFRLEIEKYRGYAALSDAAKCLFLEMIERINLEIRPKIKDPLPWQHAMLLEKIANNFQCLRAAELAAQHGYPLKAYTLLRNVSDDCMLISGVLQGIGDFERLDGVEAGVDFDAHAAKKLRKDEEFKIRRWVDGKDSGLTPETKAELKRLDDLYDQETHGSKLSRALNDPWLKGKGPLQVTPAFSEDRASIFMNRFIEVGWMAHRLLPLAQLSFARLAVDWREKWRVLDEAFEEATMALTKKLGKQVGAAVCELVHTKFPFTESTAFPNDIGATKPTAEPETG